MLYFKPLSAAFWRLWEYVGGIVQCAEIDIGDWGVSALAGDRNHQVEIHSNNINRRNAIRILYECCYFCLSDGIERLTVLSLIRYYHILIHNIIPQNAILSHKAANKIRLLMCVHYNKMNKYVTLCTHYYNNNIMMYYYKHNETLQP